MHGSRGLLLVSAILLLSACQAPPPSTACPSPTSPEPALTPDAPGRLISEPTDPIAFLYDQSALRTIELRIKDADLARLDAAPAAEQYVPGALIFDGQTYDPVAVRYKGSVGAWVGCVAGSTPQDPFNTTGAKTCPKLNLKVSFNEYDPQGRFFGVKKLQLHAMNADPSLLRERLGYWLFRQMGVPAPRATHVRLLINGQYQGLFVNVEQIDGRFTRSRFADGAGNLYQEVWPTFTAGLTAPATAQRYQAALQTNEDESPSFDKILAFSAALMQDSRAARAQAIRDWMSAPSTLRLLAVDRTIRADDGPLHFYCGPGGCGNHNFFLYEEALAPRVWLIPWDLDNAFVVTGELARAADLFLKIVYEWDDAAAPCGMNPGAAPSAPRQMPPACDPLIQALGCSFPGAYQAALGELLDGPFSAAAVDPLISAWQAQISAAVAEAYAADRRQLAPQAWRAAVANFTDRTRLLRDQARRTRTP